MPFWVGIWVLVTLVFLAFILLLKKKIVSLFLAALVFVAVLRFSPVVMSAGLLSSCGARPSHCSGFSCCWAHALGQGSVTPWQVWSSQTREPTHVPWIGRQTLNHWTPGAVLHSILLAVFRPVESRLKMFSIIILLLLSYSYSKAEGITNRTLWAFLE